MKKLLPIIIFLITYTLGAQSLSVFNVDQSKFPVMKANYFLFDNSGKEITNLNESDFEVLEDGVSRKILSISCPVAKESQPVSIAMSIDVSGSMTQGQTEIAPVELGKLTAKELCNLIGMPPSEFALQKCDDKAEILKDFTKNKSSILNAIDPITAGGNNDFNEQLLNRLAGLLNIAKTGRNKRVAVIYTDAWWQALTKEELQSCIDTSNKYNIEFYAVIYSRPESEPEGIKSSLQKLCEATGGFFYDGITEKKAAADLALRIRSLSQGGEPCTIQWESDLKCNQSQTNVVINYRSLNIPSSFYYQNQPSELVKIVIAPLGISFANITPGTAKDTTVTITAVNKDIKVINITSSNSLFSVSPTSFDLTKGESKSVIISYHPIDSNYQFAKFDLLTDLCNKQFFSLGNFPNHADSKPVLKVTNPNGGEQFLVGEDTVIAWDGLLPSDTVKIDYSVNNGISWNTVASKAAGLTFKWGKIPNTPSKECLVRVTTINKLDSVSTGPELEWQKCFGGSATDNGNDIIPTPDGGYFMVGSTFSSNGDVSSIHAQADIWAVKISAMGDLEWEKTYGGKSNEYAYSVDLTKDGGYIIGGTTSSNEPGITGYHGNTDYWVLKISVKGDIEWEKCIGGMGQDNLKCVKQTKDGGYILGGFSNSGDGDFVLNQGSYDFWITKLKANGDIDFSSSVGSSGSDQCNTVIETSNGDILAGGSTNGIDGNISQYLGGYDFWIVKFSNKGDLIWHKSYGGSKDDYCLSLFSTPDGGFFAAGKTLSSDGMIEGKKGIYDSDGWVIKCDFSGTIEWQKCLGLNGSSDELFSVTETNEGFAILGSTHGNDTSHGQSIYGDVYIVGLGFDGDLLWEKEIGGSSVDVGNSIKNTLDGGMIITGYTGSNDGDVDGNHGASDVWVVKLRGKEYNQQDISDSVFSIIAPKPEANDIDMQKCFLGKYKDSVIVKFVKNKSIFPCKIDSIYFSGTDEKSFKIFSGVPPYTLAPGDDHQIELKFNPLRIGLHQAFINIVTPSDTLVYNIIGTGVKSDLSLSTELIDFGVREIGTIIDSSIILIKNTSDKTINITGTLLMGPDTKQFEIMDGGGAFTLIPNEERKLKLRFSPVYIGRTSGSIGFDYDGFGSPVKAGLFGQGIGGYVYFNDDSAYAGDHVSLPLFIGGVSIVNLSKIASGFNATIRFQNTLLSPTDPSQISNISGDTTFVRLSGNLKNNSDILCNLDLMAGLGSIRSTSVDIIELTWLDNEGNSIDYETDSQSGNFKLLGICPEGGERLLNPNNKAELFLQPNPPGSVIKVELNLVEIGQTMITISDLNGRLISTVFNEYVSVPGIKNILIPASGFVSGDYLLTLSSPTTMITRKLKIIK